MDDYKNLNGKTFQTKFKNNTKTRKLFFGRRNIYSESIFERFLKATEWTNKIDQTGEFDLLKTIWNTFELWDKPEILIMVCIQKCILIVFLTFFCKMYS